MKNEIIKSMGDEFYPTPTSLLDKIERDFAKEWKTLPDSPSILEPSAGKGNIVDWLKKQAKNSYYHSTRIDLAFSRPDIDCIEIDGDLKALLKGKGYRVIHDDFLTFKTYKKYDLIYMNPPFSAGAEHLLKAIELQERYGGMIVCILNAETIKNPYTLKRKELIDKLNTHGATIKYYGKEFSSSNAERQTDVEIAVIVMNIPAPADLQKSFIFDKLDKAKQETERINLDEQNESNELVKYGLDFLDSYIKQYNEEVAAGVALIKEYSAYASAQKIRYEETNGDYPTLLELRLGDDKLYSDGLNKYIESVRFRYWKTLFYHNKFTGKLTSKMQNELYSSVNDMRHYDFNIHNILELMTQIRDNTLKGIESSLEWLFDELTAKYSYIGDTSKNIHYYNGWRTNNAYKINKKVIMPINGYSSFRWNSKNEYRLESYKVIRELTDISKALDYIADPVYSSINTGNEIENAISINFDRGMTENIETKYFMLTFYKKGTCHIVFKDEELLEKFNLYASKQRRWLPPDYGKKPYKNLSKEEKAVADSFSGGEQEYNKIYENQDKYLVESSSLMLLAYGEQQGD